MSRMVAIMLLCLVAVGCERQASPAPASANPPPRAYPYSVNVELLDLDGAVVARGSISLESYPGDMAHQESCGGAWAFESVAPSPATREGLGVIGNGMLLAYRYEDTLGIDLNPNVADLNHGLGFEIREGSLVGVDWDFSTDGGPEPLGTCRVVSP